MQIDYHSNTPDGQQGRTVGRDKACKGGQWGLSILQGRAVRGDQASRGGKLRANRLAGEQLKINQVGRAVVRR